MRVLGFGDSSAELTWTPHASSIVASAKCDDLIFIVEAGVRYSTGIEDGPSEAVGKGKVPPPLAPGGYPVWVRMPETAEKIDETMQ